jgi:hypothetical protein
MWMAVYIGKNTFTDIGCEAWAILNWLETGSRTRGEKKVMLGTAGLHESMKFLDQ